MTTTYITSCNRISCKNEWFNDSEMVKSDIMLHKIIEVQKQLN